MPENEFFRVEIQAARALADWKALFAGQVSEEARKLAMRGGSTGVITLGHYREAAAIVLKSLAIEIQESGICNDSEKAA